MGNDGCLFVEASANSTWFFAAADATAVSKGERRPLEARLSLPESF
jgi:hypothetical protein